MTQLEANADEVRREWLSKWRAWLSKCKSMTQQMQEEYNPANAEEYDSANWRRRWSSSKSRQKAESNSPAARIFRERRLAVLLSDILKRFGVSCCSVALQWQGWRCSISLWRWKDSH